MANRIIKHYNVVSDEAYPYPLEQPEPNKSKSISELSLPELQAMLNRLQIERSVQDSIRDLKRNSGEKETYNDPFVIDTTTPINKLYHHGILGMKWGVRRFQNPDGTRTPAGKKREAQIRDSSDYTESAKNRQKGTRKLSNTELKSLNERLQLETTYKKLTEEKIDDSKKWVSSGLREGGKKAVATISAGVMTGSAKILIEKMSPYLAERFFNIKPEK